MRLTNARAFLEGLADPHNRKRLAEVLATPAQLSTRFGLSPCSTRDVLIHGPVPIRHAGGRPMVNVREFAAAVGESGSSAHLHRLDSRASQTSKPGVPPPGLLKLKFGSGKAATPGRDLDAAPSPER